ncbi:hypothetical protein Lal_00039523 [Lupinus albus]|nr:hypothetical protein Lal_00039523 [Lupinus albus]
METETNTPDYASAMNTTREDKYSLAAQLDRIPNQCKTAEAEDKQKGDKTTKIMITSIRTQEDELSYCQADKILNQPLKQISENETEYQSGITSKDIEIGGHNIEVINDTNIEEYDLDIKEVSNLAWAGEPNLEVHEQEPSIDNSDSSHDQHRSIEVISDATEKQTIISQTNENAIPKEKEDADLEYIEQATIISEANLGLINEVLIPNLELEAKNLYMDDERVTESSVKDEDMDNKFTSQSITHLEDENKDTSLIGVQNKRAGISYVEEGEWKALESISFSNNLVCDNDNNREDKPVHGKTEDSSKASQDTGINLSNDTEEQENIPALYTGEKSDIEDGPQIIQEESKEIEPETEKQLQETAAKGVPEQEAPSTVPTLAIVEDGTIEKAIQEQTHKEEESTTIDDDKSHTPENEHEQAAKVLEEIDLLKTTSKVSAENEEHTDQKSEEQSSENMTTKHIDSDEKEKTESIQKSSYDIIEQKQTPELPSVENWEINDGGKIITEEATGEPEVKTIQPPPTIESVIVETFDKSIQEETDKDAKSTVTDTEEGQTRANDFEDKTIVLEAFELHEVNGSTCEENEKNAEPQSEASLDTIALKHPDLQRLDSTEINMSNDTEEQENVSLSGTGEEPVIKDGPRIIQEEAKDIELATEMQLPVTAIESVPREDVPSIMATATLALVQSGITEKTIQELTHEEEEPTPIDDKKSCTKEYEHDQATKVLEAINLPETMSKVSAESVEHADQKSEAQRSESVITRHVDSGEMVKMENIEKDSPELPTAEHQEINDGGKIIPEEILGVPEYKTLQSLPVIASTRVESADKSIEIHKDVELAITDTEEGQRAETEFEERTDVLEVRVDHEETENLQAPDTGEKLEVKDGDKILQGEAKEMVQGTKKQLLEAGIESVPEQEAPSTVPTFAIVEDGTIEKTIQEKTHKEEESTMIDDDKSCTPENEHEQAAKVLEAIDLLKTTSKVHAENEDLADQKSDAQSSENMTNKHIDLDKMDKTETIQKSSYDIIQQEQTPEVLSAENWKINDGRQIITEEAIGVPEVQTIHPPPTIESVILETFDINFQEEICMDAESVVTDTEEGQTRANEFEDKTNVLEAYKLHEVNGSTCEENEKNAEPRPEASLDTIGLKHPDLKKLESTGINLSNDTEEQENAPPSGTGEKPEIKDGPQIIPEEAKEIGLATEMQLPVTAIENVPRELIQMTGVPEKDAPSIMAMATLALVQSGITEKTIQELTHEEEEPTPIDDEKSCTIENEHDQATKVLEAINLPKTMSKVSAESVEHADQKSEAQRSEGVITRHVDSEEMVKMENIEKESHDVKEVEESLELPSAEHQEINDGGKIIPEEVLGMPEDQTLQSLPIRESTRVESADKRIQEEIQKDVESAMTDTEEAPRKEIEFEERTTVLEASDIHEVISRTSEENEKKAEQHSELNRNTTILKQPDLEGLQTKKINMSNDTEETENLQAPDIGEKLEVKDGEEILQEEEKEMEQGTKKQLPEAGIESVPEGQTLQPPPPLASIGVQNVDKSIQEGIHIDGKSAVTDTEEGKTHENEFADKTNSLEAFELHEVIPNTNKENEKKVQPQSAASLESIVLKHPNLEGLEKTAIKQSNDTEEVENDPESNTGEKLEIKDGLEIIQEEAREKELAIEIQLPETVTESVHEQEAPSTVTSLEIVEGGTVEKTFQEQIHEEDQQKLIDDDRIFSSENEHEQATNVLEAIGLSETMTKGSAENEELANNKSEAQSRENVITKHINSEETGTTENIEKSSYDVEDQEKTPELPSAENRETNGRGNIIQEEAIGVPEDQTLQSPPTIEPVVVQTFDKSIQEEIHKDGKSATTDTEEGQTSENEFEGKTNVLEAYDSHKVIARTTEKNEKKAKHLNLEGLGTTELNQGNDTEDLKNFKALDTVEQSSIKDSSQIIQEEAREVELETEKQLPEMATKSVPEQDAPSTMPTPRTIQSGKVEKAIQKHTHEEEESTPINDNRSFSQDNEHEQVTKFHQAIDQPEAMSKASADNEQHADKKSEASMENVNNKHIDLEEVVIMESVEKSSNDVKELKNTTELPSIKNREIKEGVKIMPVEAIGVPADQTLPSLSTTASIGVETVNNSIQEKVQKNSKSALSDTEEEHKQESEFEDKTNVLQEFKMDELIATTCEESDKKAEPQSEASIDTIVLKHPDLEVLETTEINLSNETEEQENVLASDTGNKLEIKDGPQIIQDEAKVKELATENQLPESATETIVQGGTVEKMSQEQTHEEEESKPVDDNKSCSPENEYELETKVVEAIDVPKTTSKANAENEENAKQKSEEQSIENVIAKHVDSEEMDTLENIEKSRYDVKDVEMTPELPPAESQEINDCGKILLEEALGVPRDQTLQPLPSIASDGVKTGDNSIQEEIHTHGESKAMDIKEGQTHQYESEDKTKVLQAFDLIDENAYTSKENRKKAELQSDASPENTVLKHLNLEGLETTKLNPSIDTDEPKNVSAPDIGEELEIKDYSHIIQEEAKEMELEIERQLLDSATESVPEQEARSTVPPLAIVEGGRVEKIAPKQTREEEESTPIDDNKSCARENENEHATGVLEAIDLSETMRKASVENEEHADQKSEAQSIDNMITKHIDSENEEINDSGTNMLEQAIGVPEDQTLQPLPTAESGVDDTVDKSIEEEMHKDGESTVTDTEEGLTHENESVENVLEELDSSEVIAISSKEIEKKVESQSESRLSTTALKHTSLEGLETIEINPSIETEERGNVPVSDTGKKLEKKDGAKIIQEEENVIELATVKQLPEASTANVNEQEDLSTPVIVEDGMLEKLIQEQAHEEEESTPIDDNKSNTPENKHEQESVVLEEIDLPKAMSKFNAENEEHADRKSEAQFSNVIAKHTDKEEMVTTECIEDKTQELPSSENREFNDGEKITPQEAIGVPNNQSLQSPPTIACGGVETIDKNSEKETHKDNESAVTETEEEHVHENEYEGKTNVLEAFDLHEAIASTSEDNEEKYEPGLEVSLDTIVLKHLTDPSLEGLETTEINKSIDTGKPENVSASNTGEKLEVKDGSEIIQEKAKVMELATEKMLPETTTKSVPEQESLSTMPTTAIPECEILEEIIQVQTNDKEESTLEDEDKCYTIKNEHEKETKVLEVIGLPETMSKVSAENEEHADQKSESQSSVNTITKHIDSEETVTMESIEKSNDVKEQQNTPDIPSVIHQEINDSRKTMPKKVIGVPQDQTLQPLPTIAFVGVESIDRSIQEEIHKDDESAVTSRREENTHENKFEDKMKVLEGFGLHEIIARTCEENETQPEASLNSNEIKQHDLEGLENKEINQSNDTEEPENVLALDIGEKLEIKGGAEIILVEAKNMELTTEKQLQETATESVLEDEAQTVLPTSESVKGETIEKSFQEETIKKEQSTVIDNNKSYSPENELDQTSEVLEPGEGISGGNFQAEAQRETSIPGTTLVSLNQIEDVDLADVRKFESRENSIMPNEDFSSSTTTGASEGPQRDETKNTLYSSSSLIPREVEKEDKAESFNRTNENIEEQTIDYENSIVEVKISLPIEGTVNQVKDHNVENFEATDSIEQRDIMDLSFENDPARKEAAPRDSDRAIESEAIEKLEIQELETDQIGTAKGGEGEDEFEKISPPSNDNVMIKDSQDSDVKVSHKKHHGILSGVGSKVKYSISKVKKAITGKSSHTKTSSEK